MRARISAARALNHPSQLTRTPRWRRAYPTYQRAPNGTLVPVNAGLPQLVNMTSYLQGWRQNIIDAIPDATWGPVVGEPHDL